jgi:hypothetical protein
MWSWNALANQCVQALASSIIFTLSAAISSNTSKAESTHSQTYDTLLICPLPVEYGADRTARIVLPTSLFDYDTVAQQLCNDNEYVRLTDGCRSAHAADVSFSL